MTFWTFDRADRLTDAKEHALAILTALHSRRCEHGQAGDRRALAEIDRRRAATEARYRRLCQLARAERRRVRLLAPGRT